MVGGGRGLKQYHLLATQTRGDAQDFGWTVCIERPPWYFALRPDLLDITEIWHEHRRGEFWWYFCTETSSDVIICKFLEWATASCYAHPLRRPQQFFAATVFHTRTVVPVSVNLAAIFSDELMWQVLSTRNYLRWIN